MASVRKVTLREMGQDRSKTSVIRKLERRRVHHAMLLFITKRIAKKNKKFAEFSRGNVISALNQADFHATIRGMEETLRLLRDCDWQELDPYGDSNG